MSIECTVDDNDGDLYVSLAGRLGLRDVASLHKRLLKCLAEQPDGLLIRLNELSVDEPLALAVFTAIARQAARWPGTPVLLCEPSPATRRLLRGPAYRSIPIFPTAAAARAHLGEQARTLPFLSDQLLPVTGAARHARDLATDACLRWELPHLIAPASHIASELVSNVVDHAHTMMTVRLALRPRHLNITVRDGSPEEPPSLRPDRPPADAERGRGLLLVAAMAHTWGCMPTDDGKVMWASLLR